MVLMWKETYHNGKTWCWKKVTEETALGVYHSVYADFGIFEIKVTSGGRIYKDGTAHFDVYITYTNGGGHYESMHLFKQRGHLMDIILAAEKLLFSKAFQLPASATISVAEEK